jgi:polysaccharide pyruvyl transferase WcaK-like protein
MENDNTSILISGAYGTKNLGDTKILEGLTRICREHYKNPTVIASSIDPKYTLDQTSVDDSILTIERGLVTWIKTSRNVDVIILGGGTTINHPVFGLRHSLITLVAYLMGTKIYVTAGADNKNGIQRKLSYHYLNLVDAITVRDPRSKDILHTMGIDDPVDVVPDPGLMFTGSDDLNNIDLPEKYILVSVSPTEKNIDITGIATGLDKFNQGTEYEIIFFPFHIVDGTDKKLSNEIIESMETDATVFSQPYTVEQAEAIIDDAGAVVGMRLHSLILAAHMRTPFTAISYNPKCELFLKQINVEQYFDCTDVNGTALTNSIKNIEDQEPIPASLPHIEALEKEAPLILSKCESQSRSAAMLSYPILVLYTAVTVIQYLLIKKWI